MQGLCKFYSAFEIEPAPLVNGKECCAFVFTVVSDDHTHKQSQTNHVADEDKQMDIDSLKLNKPNKERKGKKKKKQNKCKNKDNILDLHIKKTFFYDHLSQTNNPREFI